VTDPLPAPELEGGRYQVAPITSLALARWTWAVAGLLVGATLGWIAVSGTGAYRGTAVVQIRSVGSGQGNDGGRISPPGIIALASSDDVLDLAVKSLRGEPDPASDPAKGTGTTGDTTPAGFSQDYARDGGALPRKVGKDDSAARDYLARSLTLGQPSGTTDIVEVNLTHAVGSTKAPAYEANAVARAIKYKIVKDADARIDELKTELAERVKGLAATSPEVTQIRGDYLTQVDRIAFVDKQALSVIPAKQNYWVGGDPRVSGLLGAAGGTFVGALVAVAAGAGRRRPRTPRELVALAPDLVVRTTSQAGELAGRLLETGRRSLVVLALPRTAFQAAQLGMAVAHHARTHGATVAFVDRVSDGKDSTPAAERLWALRRDVRRDVAGNFSADVLVVACPADEEALSLIAGQSDLLVVVVARRRSSSLARIRRTTDAVRISEPVVVLAS